MGHRVHISQDAGRDLDRLSGNLFDRVKERILSLASDPRPPGSKKLKGREDSWRLRVGDWRVLYEVNDAEKLVTIARVLHRSKAYRRL